MVGVDSTVAQIGKVVREAIANSHIDAKNIRGVGLAVPGHIHPHDGVVHYAPNFHNQWRDVQLAGPVKTVTGLAAYLGNDANLAALGEFKYGAGRNCRHMVMFTIGTGIGGGVIIDGKLLTGADGGAGELGHMIVASGHDSRAGNSAFGSIEGMTQRDAIVERAVRKIACGRDTLLGDSKLFDKHALTPKAIFEAALAGDAVARETLDETGYYLGLGVASCINIFNPEVFVIGGGIAQAGDLLLDPIKRTARANAFGTLYGSCRVVLAELGDNAGIMGGAALVRHEMG